MNIQRKLALVLFAGLLAIPACSSSSDTSSEMEDQIANLEEKLNEAQAQIEVLTEESEKEEVGPAEPVVVIEEDSPDGEEIIEDDQSDKAESVHDDREALLATYEWYESSDYVKYLQEVLDINADGVYGPNTRAEHLAALEKQGLPMDGVPEIGPVPCPDDEPLPDTQAVGMSSFMADMDGDGNLETVNVQEGIGPDEGRFFAVATGNEFGTRWAENEFPEDEWRKGYVTDINDDGRDEFWVTHPGSASVTHYSIIIFDDCEMRIARIPDSNDLWRAGGTVMSSWEIKCQDATSLGGEPLHYLKQVRYHFGPDDEELTSIWIYKFTGSGFEFVDAVIDVFWPTSIEGVECERWYQVHPTDPNY